MASRQTKRNQTILTCEHAGNRIPREYSPLFINAEKVLTSHRGWDPGALSLARHMGRKLECPLLSNTWSRLLVEANRSPHNPRIWSAFTANLSKTERERILARWWRPYRERVEQAVTIASREKRVIHVAVHSFAPQLHGEIRNADVGLLYDPKRTPEAAICRRWANILRTTDPNLRVRMNYPYRGNADGLTTWLRCKHPASRYLGIELEINQALVDARSWRTFQQMIANTLSEVLNDN